MFLPTSEQSTHSHPHAQPRAAQGSPAAADLLPLLLPLAVGVGLVLQGAGAGQTHLDEQWQRNTGPPPVQEKHSQLCTGLLHSSQPVAPACSQPQFITFRTPLQHNRRTTHSQRTFLMMGTYDSTMFWAQSVEKAKILSLSLQGGEIVGAK